MELMPSLDNVDPTQLTSQDLEIITRNATQTAAFPVAEWAYENRRHAQAVVDFLYLGPTSVVRNLDFLKREAITLILVVRHSSMAGARLLSVSKATDVLGIAAEYVHVDGPHELIRRFLETIKLINNHLISIHHSQPRGRDQQGQMLMPTQHFRRGKVLVTCDSGNDLSAVLVAAYIMAVFGQPMVPALQFVQLQRFCCVFDEDMKRVLQSWEDILGARSHVAHHSRRSQETPQMDGPAAAVDRPKRRLDDMMSAGSDQGQEGRASITDVDRDRFTDRDRFVPFADAPANGPLSSAGANSR